MWWVLLLACGPRERDLTFPAKLEPLEAVNQAPERRLDEGEGFHVVSGTDDGWSWAHARGLVRADAQTTWSAFRRPDVHVDRRELDDWSVEQDVESDFADSFLVTNTVDRFITMSWDVVYVFEAQEGPEAAPSLAMAMWDLSEAPDAIKVLRGSAVLRSVDQEWTELEWIYQIEAPTLGAESTEQLVQDITDDLLDTVHERPLGPFD